MQLFQLAIVDHISKSDIAFNTVKTYAGEIKFTEKGIHHRDPVPACYVVFQNGSPRGDENNPDSGCIFDIVIVTESKTFDKAVSQNTNLGIATQTVKFLLGDDEEDDESSLVWTYAGERYNMDQDEPPDVNISYQDDRFTAITITAKFRRG